MGFAPERLRAMRRLRGISQEALANQTGYRRQQVSSWEQGHKIPTLLTAQRLAGALDCSIDVLVDQDGVKP